MECSENGAPGLGLHRDTACGTATKILKIPFLLFSLSLRSLFGMGFSITFSLPSSHSHFLSDDLSARETKIKIVPFKRPKSAGKEKHENTVMCC